MSRQAYIPTDVVFVLIGVALLGGWLAFRRLSLGGVKKARREEMAYEFPFDRRDVLVFYAAEGPQSLPSPGAPSFVSAGLSTNTDQPVFRSDGAPCLTAMTLAELEKVVRSYQTRGDTDSRTAEQLECLLVWARASGETHFCHQLEPIEIAGDGTACRRALQALGE